MKFVDELFVEQVKKTPEAATESPQAVQVSVGGTIGVEPDRRGCCGCVGRMIWGDSGETGQSEPLSDRNVAADEQQEKRPVACCTGI